MGFIDESQLDPVSNSGGRIIDESMLDPVDQSGGSWLDMLKGGVNSAANSALFGFGDEAAAGVRSILPGFQSYDEELAAIRGGLKDFSEQHPVASGVGTVAGALTSLPFGGLAAKGTTTLGKLGIAAGEGGAMGAAYGFGEGEGGAGARLDNALESGLIAGALSPAAKGVGAITKGAGSIFSDSGRKLEMSAFGANQTRIRKAIERMPDVIDETGEFTNPISTAIANFRADGGGKSLNPKILLKEVEDQQQQYVKELRSVLEPADAIAKDRVFIPQFKLTEDYISRLPGVQKEEAIELANKLTNSTVNNLDGTLLSIHDEKVKLGSAIKDAAWGDDANPVKVNILKRIRADLRRTVEDGFQEVTGQDKSIVANLNKKIGEREGLYPMFKDMLVKNESRDPIKWWLQNSRTSGGFGATSLGAIALGASGGQAALPILAGGYAVTPSGRKNLSTLAKAAGKGMLTAGEAADQIPSRALAGLSAQQSEPESLPQSVPLAFQAQGGRTPDQGAKSSYQGATADSKGLEAALASFLSRQPRSESSEPYGLSSNQAKASQQEKREFPSSQTTTKGSAIEAIFEPISYRGDAVQNPKDDGELDVILEAIRQVESSGGKYTTGPKTKYGTAKGSYQVLDSTGKEYFEKLGLEGKYDPYDEKQQKQIAKAILLDYMRMFDGDINKAITAYHTGPGNVKKGEIGPQGKAYLPKVEAVFNKLLEA